LLFLSLISQSLYASVWEDFTLPVTNEDSRLVLLYGGSATLVATLFKKSLSKKIQQDLKEDQPLCCRITQPGNAYLQILPNILYTFGFGLDFLLRDNEESKNLSIGMVKATLYSGLVTDTLKFVVHEKRPNGGGYKSFPSGHTTTAFAFASFVASSHPWYAGVPAYAMAAFVGFCRMHDAHHYLQDVLAGATIGISYGMAHAQKTSAENRPQSAFYVVPTDELKGVAFKYNIEF